MCGRYEFFADDNNVEIEEILKKIEYIYGKESFKTGEIFPSSTAPILTLSNNILEPHLYTWGFPQYDNKGIIINARSETINEKRMFKSSFDFRRCLIPASGYYEWKANGISNKKDKHYFFMPNNEIMYMGGIWQEFNGFKKFVILTTKANDSIRDILHRMPIILTSSNMLKWIRNKDYALEYINNDIPVLKNYIV